MDVIVWIYGYGSRWCPLGGGGKALRECEDGKDVNVGRYRDGR